MRFVGDKDIRDIESAIRLVLKEAGRQDMSLEAIRLFLKSLDEPGLRMEAEKILKSEVHQHYGRNTRWRFTDEKPWLVPLPQLRYDALPTPMLSFGLQPYLVAGITVLDGKYSYHDTPVGPIGKPYKLKLPMIFLQAILNESLERFTLMSKDGTSTTWKVSGLSEPLTLPDDFVTRLSSTLESKSVVSWLLSFGWQGRKLAPQVAGCLLGLQFGSESPALPLSGQAWSEEIVIAALTKLYGQQKARTMFNKESPYLRSDMKDEDVLKVILQTEGKGE